MPDDIRSFTQADFAAVFGPPRRPWMTWLLTGSILGVWVAQLIAARHGFDRVGTALAFSPESFVRHRGWTALTYAWAHAVPMRTIPAYAGFHLATNVVPFFCVAPAVERRCGPWGLLVLFAAGAVGSALTWWAWHPRTGDAMIGASGALFAVIAAGGTWNLRAERVDFVFGWLPLRLNLRSAAIVLCLFELVQMFFHQMPDVAHVAHLGGAVVGVVVAAFLTASRCIVRGLR